ncbi:MAG: hypothetical protein OXD34_05555, partial [bacterium]|nr:hypothetical protein [bacterium]
MTEEAGDVLDGALAADRRAGRAEAWAEHQGRCADIEREWPWVDVLPECDRRLFAEEMSQLLAEAAETDDLAEGEQALREWRGASEADPAPQPARRVLRHPAGHAGRAVAGEWRRCSPLRGRGVLVAADPSAGARRRS